MTDLELRELVFNGQPLTDIKLIDAHAHIGPYKEFRMLEYTAESILRGMDKLGVEMSCISSIPGCIGSLYQEWNSEIIKAVKQWPGRFFGYMSVNPLSPTDAFTELKRCYDQGIRGIKVHSSMGIPYDDPSYKMIWEFAERYSLPVLAHTWGLDGIAQLTPLFTRYPSVTWILAHGGSEDREAYIHAAFASRNVYVDTVLSAGPRGLTEYFMKSGLSDRLLWGTDITFMNAPHQLGKIIFADITIEQKLKILGENAIKALKLKIK